MILNMRDLGGLKTADGRTLRRGVLFRSANLSAAEPGELEGISAVIDLRTSRERQELPDRCCGMDYLPIPIFDVTTPGITHEKRALETNPPDMTRLYVKLVSERADSLGRVLRAIMEHDFSTGAILWHCTEGKDRCGITTALLLETLGVSRSAIMEDYLKTNEVNLPKALRLKEKLSAERGEETGERIYKALIADESYLRAAWDAMEDGYIGSRLGIDEGMAERFGEKVLC